MITCTKCKQDKPESEMTTGHSWCRDCMRLYKHNYRPNSMLASAKQRAKKKGLEFTITLEDIQIPEVCPLLGVKLDHNHTESSTTQTRGICSDFSPTLDRIDNSRGYTPDNIWVVSALANRIMTNATAEQIIDVGVGLLKKLYTINPKQLDFFDKAS